MSSDEPGWQGSQADAERLLGLDLPERIELAPGESRSIPLPSAAGAGYAWQAEPAGGEADAAGVALRVGSRPLDEGEPSSTPAPVFLETEGQHPGRAVWRLRLVRAWQPDSPLIERDVEVVVKP